VATTRTRSLKTAVRASLRDVKTSEIDRGVTELALTYAGLIDEATPASKYREPLELLASVLPGDPKVTAALSKIVDALGRHSVASDLGPKLLATLDALGLTPRARAALTKGAGTGVQRDGSPLDELRARRHRSG